MYGVIPSGAIVIFSYDIYLHIIITGRNFRQSENNNF